MLRAVVLLALKGLAMKGDWFPLSRHVLLQLITGRLGEGGAGENSLTVGTYLRKRGLIVPSLDRSLPGELPL